MSHRDYSKFSKPFNNNEGNEVVDSINIEDTERISEVQEIDVPITEKVCQEVEETQKVIGIVSGCEMLNVRNEPSIDSDIVNVIPKGLEVEVDYSNSTADFYKVKLPVEFLDANGYCMKKFITIK